MFKLTIAKRRAEAPRTVDPAKWASHLAGDLPLAQAIGLTRTHVELLRCQLLAFARVEDWPKVEACAELLLLVGDKSPPVRFVLARACRERGDLVSAEQHQRAATAALDGTVPTHARLLQAAQRWPMLGRKPGQAPEEPS